MVQTRYILLSQLNSRAIALRHGIPKRGRVTETGRRNEFNGGRNSRERIKELEEMQNINDALVNFFMTQL